MKTIRCEHCFNFTGIPSNKINVGFASHSEHDINDDLEEFEVAEVYSNGANHEEVAEQGYSCYKEEFEGEEWKDSEESEEQEELNYVKTLSKEEKESYQKEMDRDYMMDNFPDKDYGYADVILILESQTNYPIIDSFRSRGFNIEIA